MPTSSSDALIADVPTSAPEASLAVETPQAATTTPESSGTLTPPGGPALPYDVFGAAVFIGLRGYHISLDETEPGHLTGKIHMPLPLPDRADDAELVFMQFSAPWAPGRPVQIGQWPVSLKRFNVLSDRIKLVVNTAVSAEEASDTDAPRPSREGFWIRAGLHTEAGIGTVEIDIRVGPHQQLIALDDGLFGPRGNAPEPAVVALPGTR